jgi:hypothetical protein
MAAFISRNLAPATAILFAGCAVALFPGCKNTTDAAMAQKAVTAPPTLFVDRAAADPRNANPLSDPIWTSASWYTLTAPSNTTRTTPPVRAALLYDTANLYVAFVSDTVPPPAAPIARDMVSIFLDSSQVCNGTEIAEISVSSDGKAACNWLRNTSPAQMKDDGSPDGNHPYQTIPVEVKGLFGKAGTASENGATVWTAVIAIPLGQLPQPFRRAPDPSALWKINLLRTIITADTGSGPEQFQANLSQVYVGAQPISPYRLATLRFSPPSQLAKTAP